MSQMVVCYNANTPYLIPLSSFNMSLFISVFISFIFPLLIGGFLKPLLRKARSAGNYKKEAARLKYHPQVFHSILQSQRKISEPTAGLGIMIGNPDAKHTLVKVCNPYCGPCAKAHRDIEEILEANPDIKLQIIFTAENSEKDIKAAPVKHFMALNNLKDKRIVEAALKDWYGAERRNYATFEQRYPIEENLLLFGKELEAMSSWCEKMNIRYTPTCFVDGYELPRMYELKDIIYFF